MCGQRLGSLTANTHMNDVSELKGTAEWYNRPREMGGRLSEWECSRPVIHIS